MAVAAILDSIDDLDPVLQAEYTKKKIGDKEVYVLDVTGFNGHPEALSLKTALDRQKKDNKTLKDEKTALEDKYKEVPEDFTADEWHRLQGLDIDENDPEAKTKRKAKDDERLATQKRQYEQQIAALNTKYEKDIGERDKTIETERAGRAGDKADTQLTDALVKAGVKPELMKGAKSLHKGFIKHEIGDDGVLRVFVETDLGEQEIGSYIETWSKSDEGKAYIAPPSGGDANGNKRPGSHHSGESNPFAHGSWNKTEQAKLVSSDRTKAERFAKSAGFATLDIAIKAIRANTPPKQ
jgi:hypothetical protein